MMRACCADTPYGHEEFRLKYTVGFATILRIRQGGLPVTTVRMPVHSPLSAWRNGAMQSDYPAAMKKKTPSILIALSLAYQNGRDYYMGILHYLARRRRKWEIRLVRQGLDLPTLENEARWGLDGVIIDYDVHDDAVSAIRRLGIPCVALDTAHPDLFKGMRHVAFIDIDSCEIGRRGAEHFLARYNYAAYGVLGFEATCNWSERRVESFAKTLEEKQLTCEALRVRRDELRTPALHRTMCDWAERLHRPAAVMVVCDELARTFISALSAHGIRVPKDVAVLGVDNEWILCTHMSPTLSSIQPDFERSGFLAAESMDAILREQETGGTKPRRHVQSPVSSIVVRESTAPSSTTGLMVLRAENFIRDHVGENIHVGDVARHLKVSRRLLDLRFREVTGRTVLSAIHAAQLENVRRLLRTTALSISEIGTLYHFRSESQLKRLFKAAYGMTMTDARAASMRG